MINIDGSFGEGGGQILRSALGLSLVTGKPFRIHSIRAGRAKPGLLRQHLTAVCAAKEIGRAEVQGDSLKSGELSFKPNRVKPGSYRFSIGTAGSATLVLQTVLPALMIADEPSELTLEGGTHNPFAPPFDFLTKAFLPLLAKIGPKVSAELERPGFYPAGGGCFRVRIQPAKELSRLKIPEHGKEVGKRARAVVASLSTGICERELRIVGKKLNLTREQLATEELENSMGPGNVVFIELEYENVCEVVTAFGSRGVRAEAVAERAVKEARKYLTDGAPVGEHLADQLLIPMAMAGAGSYRTCAPSMHTQTNGEVVKKFLRVNIEVERETKKVWKIEAGG